MIQFDHVSLRRGGRLLFTDASFSLFPGQRAGLTGANGTGKSSILALIRGELQADSGSVRVPAQWRIAHVAQETPAQDTPARDYVLAGDPELTSIRRGLAEAEARGDGMAQAELHERLEAAGGYDAEARAGRLLRGLGFAPAVHARPVRSFSGGWRMRLNLARALMRPSDLLLLDEPTNHLDLDAVLWLEDWLQRYAGTLLLISHDRDFLDRVVDRIVHVEQGRVDLYTGNYSEFERQRATRLAQQQAAHERQQRQRAHIRAFVDRFRAKATKARQAQSRLKALERMEEIAPAHVDSPFSFRFPEPERLPDSLLSVEAGAAGYGDQVLLRGIRLSLHPGDRIGLLGPNGAGKSTLIRTLAGELPLLGGRMQRARDLAVGYFAQHQLEQLDGQASPLLHLQRLDPGATEQAMRDFLGGFGFAGDRALEPVAPFSGGEKARLALALLVWQRPNLLLLDEPTNHLDLEMRLALELALAGYPGAVILVSHDRHLLRSCADRFWRLGDGRLADFDGDLDDYRRWLQRGQAQATAGAKASDSAGATPSRARGAAERRAARKAQAAARARLAPLRRELEALEEELTTLQARRTELEARLADPGLYAADAADELQSLLVQKGELDATIERAEAAWLEVGERLEAESPGP